MGNTNSFDLKYSVIVDSATPPAEDQTEVRRSATHPDALVVGLSDVNVLSCWDIFQLGRHTNPDGPCLGRRIRKEDGTLGPFKWLSYSEVEDSAIRIGSGLLDLDITSLIKYPNEVYEGARAMRLLGMFSKNRIEWFLCEQAANAFGITIVPLYDTLGHDAVRHILQETQMSCVACSSDCIEFVIKAASDTPYLKHIISFDSVTDELIEIGKKSNITIHHFETFQNWSTKRDICPGELKDVATLCYTSGTTGNPKGVILSQGNFVSCICASIRGPLGSSKGLDISSTDIHISYLPLAHVFERAICNVVLALGAAIGVYSGDTLKLLDDLRELQPTVFISVPRLFNRINDKVFGGVKEKSAVVRYLFETGVQTKLKKLRTDASVTHNVWDPLVFNKTKQLMGGKLRYMLAGGAPIDALVQDRMKVLFCAPLCEGYGLTETLGASFITSPEDPLSGHVGGPVPAVEFCLQSVPEMEYDVHANPPQGELLLRGPTLCHGYFANPEETNKAFDSNGWFHTGDVVVLLPNGGIKIIDRRKNIFKLAQGEYVAPEKIEAIYSQTPLISQVFAFGYSSKFVLVGIVVPDEEMTKKWAKAHNMSNETLQDICKNSSFKTAVLQEMEVVGKDAGLKGFEKLKDITLIPEPFTIENGLLTPTFKLKRHQAKQVFDTEINTMYANLE